MSVFQCTVRGELIYFREHITYNVNFLWDDDTVAVIDADEHFK